MLTKLEIAQNKGSVEAQIHSQAVAQYKTHAEFLLQYQIWGPVRNLVSTQVWVQILWRLP